MKTFQKIKTLANAKKFIELNRDKGYSMPHFEADDTLVVTEKIDGANAQVCKVDGKLVAYSYHKQLNETNTLNGFYNFVQENHDDIADFLNEKESLFGEWLVPHKLKYPESAYRKWYLFDLFIFKDEESGEYKGYKYTKQRYDNSLLKENDNIHVFPEFSLDDVNIETFDDFQKLADKLIPHSLMGALNERAEGIVVTDLDKPIQKQGDRGYLIVKIVDNIFQETRHAKQPLDESRLACLKWVENNITDRRIDKQIMSLNEDGELMDNISFDWLKNGNAKMISEHVEKDAYEEALDLPEGLKETSPSYKGNKKFVKKLINKKVNSFIALTVKQLTEELLSQV